MNKRLHIVLRGVVQGVGFRPFVYRLARELGLRGWVANGPEGVTIEAEAPVPSLQNFLLRLEKDKPAHAFIQSFEYSYLDPVGFSAFEIRESQSNGRLSALVLADIATCPDCLAELFDAANRRYLYPFTNCTQCGPRFSIIESMPYDRARTSMKLFPMCPACVEEYENPLDRRFHAQPNACPVCGPHLELWDSNGSPVATHQDALDHAAQAIRKGNIVAMKGLGGFQLLVDASSDRAVSRLRERKRREEKPFALMFPSLALAKTHCDISPLEERLLCSAESPIVLLRRKDATPAISPFVAPGNPNFGLMLPYTPLHHLLMRSLQLPIVATSGNISDEPLCTDEREAITRLRGIADCFLVHNRPIRCPVDDSIVRVVLDRELVLRRARGYAPLPISIIHPSTGAQRYLAVGAHQKNTVAIHVDGNVFISQHLGDLETHEAFSAFRRGIESLTSLYQVKPTDLIADLHPEYLSTKYAKDQHLPVHFVQHHWAHVASCMAENQLEGSVLGVAWDGTGFGPDGTIWGGEFLIPDNGTFFRFASFNLFPLPGGEKAVREPRRSAAGMLVDLPEDANDLLATMFSGEELKLVGQMIAQKINSPLTSSVGRMFDAVAAIIGIRTKCSFEGQSAMELEYAADRSDDESVYPYSIDDLGTLPVNGQCRPRLLIDWCPMLSAILADCRRSAEQRTIARKFHNTLAEMILDVSKRSGERRIVLTGGCFQNKLLLETAVRRLSEEDFQVYFHQRVPPNDGGISLGQLAATMRLAHIVPVVAYHTKENDHVPGSTRKSS